MAQIDPYKLQLLEIPECRKCPLYRGHIPKPQPTYGDPDTARVAIIGAWPHPKSIQTGNPFLPNEMNIVIQTAESVGIAKEELYLFNFLNCTGELAWKSTNEDNLRAISSCEERVTTEIDYLQAVEVVIIMGADTVKAFFGKTSSLDSMLGSVFFDKEKNKYFIPTYHPEDIEKYATVFTDFQFAFRQANMILSDQIPDNSIKETIVATVETYPSVMETLLKEELLSCDIETDSLDFITGSIISIGFGTLDTAYILPDNVFQYSDEYIDLLSELFKTVRCVYHHGKFDAKWNEDIVGHKVHVDDDTMLLHYALDERSPGSIIPNKFLKVHDLKTLSKKYLFIESYNDEMGAWLKKYGSFKDVDRAKLYAYQAKDLVYTRKLLDILFKELEDDIAKNPPINGIRTPIDVYLDILLPVNSIMCELEAAGIKIDVDKLDELDKSMKAQADEYEAKFNELTKDSILAPLGIRSTKQLSSWIYTELKAPPFKSTGAKAVKSDTVNVDALELYIDYHPAIRQLLNYRKVNKAHSTYVLGYKENNKDGRIYTNIFITGTTSGRLSTADMNTSNVPRSGPIKKVYIPESEDETLVELDFKALEIRVAQFYSKDENMALDLEGDFHWNVAYGSDRSKGIFHRICSDILESKGSLKDMAMVADTYSVLNDVASLNRTNPYTDEQKFYDDLYKSIRTRSKETSFGVIYREGHKTLAKNLKCSDADAKAFLEAYMRKFRDLDKFINKTIATVMREGWIDTPMGRRRRFLCATEGNSWKIKNQCVNFPIQSLAGDILFLALIKIHAYLKESWYGRTILTVYDSILMSVQKKYLDEVITTITNIAEWPFVDYAELEQRQFLVDIKTGPNWADCKEYVKN